MEGSSSLCLGVQCVSERLNEWTFKGSGSLCRIRFSLQSERERFFRLECSVDV